MLNHNFYKGRSGRSSPGGKSGSGRVGRVVKVLTDINDPDCTNPSMLNGVYYRDILLNQREDFADTLQFAYQSSTTFKKLPLPGELVKLEKSSAKGSATTPGSKGTYWTDIVNIWNHPYHGALPDTKQEDWQANLLGGIEEIKTINPLQPNPGDIVVEGRLGQSIRIGGYGPHPQAQGNSQKPTILIRNGQVVTDNGIDYIYEDINKDANSIYLVSDHKVPLTAANNKRDSYDVAPIRSNEYIGNQVIVNGGRLYFNAKNDSALISAKESIGLNASTLNFDAQEYACIDAKRIYLGSSARASAMREPAVLGIQLENWLTILLDSLESVAIAMSSAAVYDVDDSGAPITRPVMSVATVGPELGAAVKSLKTQIELFQSKKVFTE
jgi:hypothetical protein